MPVSPQPRPRGDGAGDALTCTFRPKAMVPVMPQLAILAATASISRGLTQTRQLASSWAPPALVTQHVVGSYESSGRVSLRDRSSSSRVTTHLHVRATRAPFGLSKSGHHRHHRQFEQVRASPAPSPWRKRGRFGGGGVLIRYAPGIRIRSNSAVPACWSAVARSASPSCSASLVRGPTAIVAIARSTIFRCTSFAT